MTPKGHPRITRKGLAADDTERLSADYADDADLRFKDFIDRNIAHLEGARAERRRMFGLTCEDVESASSA